MSGEARIALAQVQSGREPEANLETAERLTVAAAEAGGQMVIFPEYLMSWGPGRHRLEEMAAVAQPLGGRFVDRLRELARGHGVWIVGGVIEAVDAMAKPYNTTVVIDDQGKMVARYRKTHLFDAYGHRESDIFASGSDLVDPIVTPAGQAGFMVCYELRFPEVARAAALAGAEILIVPSAWVAGPLKDMHWETLLRARAIENGCYVVAAAQTGNEFAGQSMVIDPAGVVISAMGAEDGLLVADISPDRLREVRETLPSLRHRRPELY